MTHDQDHDFAELDGLFAAARRTGATLPEARLEHLTAQALAVQAEGPAPRSAPPRPRPLMRFLLGIGGWPALAGLATAGVAGLWIGAMPPAFVETIAAQVTASTDAAEDDLYLVDPLPGYPLALELGDGS